MPWTEEQIAQLPALWGESLSAREIGDQLGHTKNAVIGMAHRLRLPPRKKVNGAPKPHRSPTVRIRPRQVALRFPNEAPCSAPIDPVPFMELKSHHCRAVVGRSPDGLALFCGSTKAPKQSWCPYHCRQFLIYRNVGS